MFEQKLLKRACVNKDEQVVQTINSLVSYACITETSYSKICALFRSAILNSSETATLSSIAAKLEMSTLRGRVVPGPEADFQNLAQPYTISLGYQFIFGWMKGVYCLQQMFQARMNKNSSQIHPVG